MDKTIDIKIENILNNEKIKKILERVGKSGIAPIKRVSNMIGEIYTYCIAQNDGKDFDINDVISYIERMDEAYFECNGSEESLQDIRATELRKSIAKRLNIDISSETISKEEDQQIQDYFLKNYVENGYVTHSFPGAAKESILEHGFSSTKRLWDNNEIMNISNIFEEKAVISPFGGYSHYSGGGMYVENDTKNIYWHSLSAPEWFKWFTSANHNNNSTSIEDSPYYLRNYEGCKQNVLDLCINSELDESETKQVMLLFEKNWELLGTERMCVALIPKSVIGKNHIEDANISGESVTETIKTVLSDGRRQYTEHYGNVLKQTITEKDMIIMTLPNSIEIFGEHEFKRESRSKLYDPKLVLDMIFRGTKIYDFELSQEKIESIIKTIREVHNNSSEVEQAINDYNKRVELFSGQRTGNSTISIAAKNALAQGTTKNQVLQVEHIEHSKQNTEHINEVETKGDQ